MQLRVVFLVAFGPALTTCQNPTITGQAPISANALGAEENWTPGFIGKDKNECPKTPNTPQTFTAKRVFWSVFNTIIFYDRKGVEFGYVESWLGDYKNIFGYPGASFYLKVQPTQSEDEGIWNIDPKPNNQGWDQNSMLTHEGLAQDEETTFGQEAAAPTVAPTGQQEGQGGLFESFYRDFQSNKDHRLSAFMVGNHEEPVGKFWEDEMTVRDCKGRATVKAFNGNIIFRNAADSQYYQKRSNTDNQLVITDLGTPPKDLVKLNMQEPCRPFPTPFTCAGMGMYNWFIHGYKWEGNLLKPGSDSVIGGGMLEVETGGGKAEDMRFLTLYSAYQFSNTRWSPCMNLFWWILFLIGLVGCCRCCCGCLCRSSESSKAEATAKSREETEKLMQTIETEKAPLEKQEQPGFLACCSRRGGRGVEVK